MNSTQKLKRGTQYVLMPRNTHAHGSKRDTSKYHLTYTGDKRGRGVTHHMFRNTSGKWLTAYTDAQLADFDVRCAP